MEPRPDGRGSEWIGRAGRPPYFAGSNFSDTPFMQYRSPVGPGPSGKTWPRWPPQRAQLTSVRLIPWLLSGTSSTAPATAGSVKLGQPVPESNLASELNSSAPQAPQRYIPSAF